MTSRSAGRLPLAVGGCWLVGRLPLAVGRCRPVGRPLLAVGSRSPPGRRAVCVGHARHQPDRAHESTTLVLTSARSRPPTADDDGLAPGLPTVSQSPRWAERVDDLVPIRREEQERLSPGSRDAA